MKVAIIGAGRAGTSFAAALGRVGHLVQLVHHEDLASAVASDVVLLTVPDDAIGAVSRALAPDASRVVAHVAGSRTLAVLEGHPRVGSLHPLVPLPSTERGARRLVGATYCVAGDPAILDLARSLRGRVISLPDGSRTAYHATASVAANHLVALMGHVARLAESAGLELEDFLPLARQALDDVAALGPLAALTGPASRGDMATVDAHLSAIPETERATYVALANAALETAELARTRTPA
jgi:predicted short-subunit dehydrogenase-like oxidoreductase (DUF2520 family)